MTRYRARTRARPVRSVNVIKSENRHARYTMAARHYAHQYAMRLTDEKIADGNVSGENSDVEDYYPLIHRSVNGAMASAEARRRAREAGWETVKFHICLVRVSLQSLGIVPCKKIRSSLPISTGTEKMLRAFCSFAVLQNLTICRRDRSFQSRAVSFFCLFVCFFLF